MDIAIFKHRVKHGGVYYAPGEPIEIKKSEIKEMKKRGATIVSSDEKK